MNNVAFSQYDAARWFGKAMMALASGAMLLAFTSSSPAAERQVLSGHEPEAIARLNLKPVGRMPGTNRLNLAIGLPLRNTNALNKLLQDMYDPRSPQFRRYLTPEQFTEKFGPTKEDYQAVMEYAKAHHLVVTGTHPNRVLLDVSGAVADIERALRVTMRTYQHPKEARQFYAPDAEPSLDVGAPVLFISGLDDYAPPRPSGRATTQAPAGRAGAANGSGPYGAYTSKDLRTAYAQGITNTGTGQVLGIFEVGSGYDPHDIQAFETLAGLSNVTLSNVLVDGYGGAPGFDSGEVTLDIEMAIAMAPGLSQVIVYEGLLNPDDILNRMVTDNLARQMSCSWFWAPTYDPLAHQAFLQMAAQGQSMFVASGDCGAFTSTVEPAAPEDDPYVTLVGGTTLTMTGNVVSYQSETVWNFGDGSASSGGSSVQYAIPSWQQGINMAAIGGSTNYRNMPDVAMPADNWVTWFEGAAGAGWGTSGAAPLWAGFTALVNQTAQASGEPPVGFLNPAFYALGQGPTYASLFHDIVTGNNTNSGSPTQFKAAPGYDLCTGWGSPRGSNLMYALAVPEPLQITPRTASPFTGPVGGPFLPALEIYTLINKEAELNWAVGADASWLSLSPASGALGFGGSTNVTVQLNSESGALPAGAYSANLFFTNLSDGAVQTQQVTLAIVTAPVITSPPANTEALDGASASFSVATATNALLEYQWQFNNGSIVTNLTDGGNISGSATSVLTIAGVSSTNLGSYSVLVSNAAGTVSSAAASLSLVPSLPVILGQPTNQAALPGASVFLNVAAVGGQPLFYSWQMDGANLTDGGGVAGSASNTLTIANVTVANAGSYVVVVSNSLGAVTSSVAVLTVPNTSASGVTLNALYSFPANSSFGAYPYAGLVQAGDGNFYGAALQGGSAGDGTLFKMTSGGAVTLFHTFVGSDGAYPYGGLVQGTGGILYGTTKRTFPTPGSYDGGTIYKLTTNGSFVSLSSFSNNSIFLSAGWSPRGTLILGQDGNYYGTCYYGGDTYFDQSYGAVFRVTASGAITGVFSMNYGDGASSSSALLQGTDGAFYGTAQIGGTNGGWGTVFRVTDAGQASALISFNNTNGAQPTAGLVQDQHGSFYGTTYAGGASGDGTVFKLGADETFSSLYSFTGGSDGSNCYAGLLLASDGNFYGVTESGGTYGAGTAFRMSPRGSLQTLAQFDGYQGAHPEGTLIQGADGRLYGTTRDGGTGGKGAVFQISLDGALQITEQPQSQTVFAGQTVVMSVATFGALPVSYQWLKNGTNLIDGGNVLGSTYRVLTLTNAGPADAATYSVAVSNTYGSVTSAGAPLSVIYSPPSIVVEPGSQTVLVGTSASFAVEADGDAPLVYQWQKNGTNLVDSTNVSGSGTAALTLSVVSAASAGSYSVLVSNSMGAAQSSNAVLTVVPVVSPSAAVNVLHSFTNSDDGGNGVFSPFAGVMQAKDGNLYGTAVNGGPDGTGVIYKLTTAGVLSILGSFGAFNSAVGIEPLAGLVQGADGNLYGATFEGGESGAAPSDGGGVLYRENANGSPVPIYTFATYVNGDNGSGVAASLILGNDGNFYGTTEYGGNPTNITASPTGINDGGFGTVFKSTTNGVLTTLAIFNWTNGAYPVAPLRQGSDGTFYGTTSAGGSNGYGAIFSLATNGALTTLASFDYIDGAFPSNGVVLTLDDALYGTTALGGANGWGTVFRLGTDGALAVIHSFDYDDGAVPVGGLVQGTDGNLYGTTSQGGVGGDGTVFQITTNGQLTTLLWFYGTNGSGPQASLIQARDGRFYGTTEFGGAAYNQFIDSGDGLVFRLVLPMFLSNPITQANATATVPYSASLSENAAVPTGDVLSFAKVSGPAWLTVATNGTLAGNPGLLDVGTNLFIVSLADTNGWSSTATMSITVAPLPSISISPQGTNFILIWTGGQPPYSVQTANNLASPVWQTIAGPMTNTTLLVTPTNSPTFYRIQLQ